MASSAASSSSTLFTIQYAQAQFEQITKEYKDNAPLFEAGRKELAVERDRVLAANRNLTDSVLAQKITLSSLENMNKAFHSVYEKAKNLFKEVVDLRTRTEGLIKAIAAIDLTAEIAKVERLIQEGTQLEGTFQTALATFRKNATETFRTVLEHDTSPELEEIRGLNLAAIENMSGLTRQATESMLKMNGNVLTILQTAEVAKKRFLEELHLQKRQLDTEEAGFKSRINAFEGDYLEKSTAYKLIPFTSYTFQDHYVNLTAKLRGQETQSANTSSAASFDDTSFEMEPLVSHDQADSMASQDVTTRLIGDTKQAASTSLAEIAATLNITSPRASTSSTSPSSDSTSTSVSAAASAAPAAAAVAGVKGKKK